MSESTLSNRTFGALLFDMDGTILNSIAAAERVWPLDPRCNCEESGGSALSIGLWPFQGSDFGG